MFCKLMDKMTDTLSSLNVPQAMTCSIPLPKTSLKEICIEYNIPYHRTVRDYRLVVNDSSGVDSSGDESYVSIEETNTYVSESMTRTKKKKSKKVSKSSPKKRKASEKMVSNKWQKTCTKNTRVAEKV